MERSILRSELRSASASPSPPSDDEALDRLRNLNTLQFTSKDVTMNDAPPAPAAEDEDEEMMFNLFAPSKPSATSAQPETQQIAQKIRIRSPSLDPEAIGFLHPGRPRSYYIAEPATKEAKAAFDASALSGEQILKLSALPRPGSAYEWKVMHIPSSQLSRAARIQSAQFQPAGFSKLGLEGPTKRRRAGKKLRIKIRSKANAAKAKQEAASKSKAEKEEAEKEKRTRRNREKKVKRKEKEKAKKAAGGGGGDAAEAAEEDSGDE